jgi:CRISPR-associated protein Csx1
MCGFCFIDMRVALVATWGLPINWRRAKYVLPNFPKGLCGRPIDYQGVRDRVENYSSTAAIREVLMGYGHEVRTVVIGLESIVAKCPSRGGIKSGASGERGVNEEGGDEKVRLDEEVCNENDEFFKKLGSVEELRREAEDRLRRYAKLFVGGAELIVLPATGAYRGYYFEGSLDNARFILVNELYSLLRQWGPDAVVLDITHGVNYMPALAYGAVRTISKVLNYMYERPSCFLVLNSDPVMVDGQEVRVNVVESLKLEDIRYDDVVSELTTDVEVPLRNVEETGHEAGYREELSEVVDYVSRLSRALRLGLLLYFVTKYKEVIQGMSKVGDIINYVKEKVLGGDVERDGNEIIIKRIVAADPELPLLNMHIELLRQVGEKLSNCEDRKTGVLQFEMF